MVPVEIERKFTIKYLPKEVESIKKITQKHIFKDMICSICELERNISEEDYNKLQPFEGSRIIEKYRCIVPLENGLKAEVDIFEGWMEGLIIAEVEFQNVEQAENFVIPEWFDKCVPNREFSNRKLSTATRTEILDMVGCAQLEVNKKILKDLKQNSLKKNRP